MDRGQRYSRHRAGAANRARIIVVGGLALLLLGIGAMVLMTLNPWAETAEERVGLFADAWQRGDDRAVARMTDQPDVALRALEASRKGLDDAKLQTSGGTADPRGDRASATLDLSWSVPRIGVWRYRTSFGLEQRDDRWVVRWSPQVIHPKLTDETRLGTSASEPRRGPIVDRAGRPLMEDRDVVDVALKTDEVDDAQQTAARLEELVDVDADRLERTILDAGKGRFVPVITLRQAEYDRLSDELEAVRGTSFNQRRSPLAPTKGFGRALLGAVGPATAEQVKRSEGRVKAGDQVGQWGLQGRFDEQLRGTPTREIVRRTLDGGDVVGTLLERRGRDGRALRTTLDRRVQAAAESALGARAGKAALVAVKPSTGDVLAVANRPTNDTFDRALEGLYPPGSTFKVVSTAALLRDGLDVDQVVDCPATRNVGGRSFRNFEGGAAGPVPFRIDFAQSCNTAFVGLSRRLDPAALTETGRDFGFGEAPKLPLKAATSQIPQGSDEVARAAMMIGQDRIVASPLAMAGVAATVADGRWRAPRLVRDDPRRAAEPLDEQEASTLRELMRSVVTSGTGTALAGVPGEPAGKSGTAEYGSGDPPPTHAWFIAYREDVAVAVLVEGGRAGGEVAAPIAAKFFTTLSGVTSATPATPAVESTPPA
jgi:cell division protein FtsI/penicillin-binding protein 2